MTITDIFNDITVIDSKLKEFQTHEPNINELHIKCIVPEVPTTPLQQDIEAIKNFNDEIEKLINDKTSSLQRYLGSQNIDNTENEVKREESSQKANSAYKQSEQSTMMYNISISSLVNIISGILILIFFIGKELGLSINKIGKGGIAVLGAKKLNDNLNKNNKNPDTPPKKNETSKKNESPKKSESPKNNETPNS